MNDASSGSTRAGTGAFVALLMLAAITIVAFDALAAWSSMAVPFPYFYAMLGSCLLYGLFGFIGARRFGFGRALALGAWIGVVDASLGWAVSWAIGAGRVPEGPPTFGEWLPIGALVATVAVVCAGVGAGIGVLARRR